jgi:hypothetical protein
MLPQTMSLSSAKEIAGTLSKTSKMPGYSTGLPAVKCITGSKLVDVKGSVCEGCYALKGMYRFPAVQAAQERRLSAITHPRWVDAMVVLISHYCRKQPYFRWHDSGDLQSVTHLEKIVKVCERTLTVQHWMPTRERGLIHDYLTRYNAFPDNLTVRLSAHMRGDWLDYPSMGLTTSTVHSDPGQPIASPEGKSIECRAYLRSNECGKCRACWSGNVSNVSYLSH